MAHLIDPPSPEAVALERELLLRIQTTDLSDIIEAARRHKPMSIGQLADSFVWGLANSSDSMVPQTVNEVMAAMGQRTVRASDVTVEVQCLLAWKSRSVIEAITGLADGGRLGAEYRRWYAHRLRRVQCGLPPTRLIDQRLDEYTRVVSGEQSVFAWAAAYFASLVAVDGVGSPAIHAVQLAVVNRLAFSYGTGVLQYAEMYANVRG